MDALLIGIIAAIVVGIILARRMAGGRGAVLPNLRYQPRDESQPVTPKERRAGRNRVVFWIAWTFAAWARDLVVHGGPQRDVAFAVGCCGTILALLWWAALEYPTWRARRAAH